MLSKAVMKRLEPEIIYQEGNALVPAKALKYKKDDDGNPVEVLTPSTVQFEDKLKSLMRKELEGIDLFPTEEEVFVVIEHGRHSERSYLGLDLDNTAKSILDALKDVVYQDDSQVRLLWTNKKFLKKEQESYFFFSVKILNTQAITLLEEIMQDVVKGID